MTQAEFSQGLELPHCTAYDAYQLLLRRLLLQEFPCGLGEWREDYELVTSELAKARQRGSGRVTVKPNLTDYTSAVTLKDASPWTERTETLAELTKAKESPWRVDCDWTEEGEQLRQLAVTEPWTVTCRRVNRLLRTLKLHDRNVGEIDSKMVQLPHLQQLVLSANYLTWIDGKHLPQQLKMLELHGNFIDDLSGLLPQPPRTLEHLGVGRNEISFVEDHLSGVNWPSLLSLDLSYNHLVDLKSLLESVATLPKLRSLVLAGNPLALTPWYRGYTIDSLRSLLILDDAKISADERHYFRGMVRRREFVQDKCELRIRVSTLQNLPVPPEVQNPEDFPEFPLIVRKYYVQFWLPYEEAEEPADASAMRATPGADAEEAGDDSAALETKGKLQKSTGLMSDIPEEPVDERRDSGPGRPATIGREPLVTRLLEGTVCSPLPSLQRTYAELANGEAPNEVNWNGHVTRCDLRRMRDFLLHHVLVEVVEEKSQLYPPDQLPQENQEGKQADKKKEEKKDDAKPKKKKKIDESSLVAYCTDTQVLASISLDLSDLLGAGQKVELLLKSQPPAPPPSTAPSTPANNEKKPKDAKAAKDDKKKDAKARNSAKPGNKKGGKEAPVSNEEEAEERQPEPLQVQVEFQRAQWRSVKDCPTNVMIAVDHN